MLKYIQHLLILAIFSLISINNNAQVIPIDPNIYELLPYERQVNWTVAGLSIQRPNQYQSIIDLSQGEYALIPNNNSATVRAQNSMKLNQVIANQRSNPNWKVLYIPAAGNYYFSNTISFTLQDSNIVLKGTQNVKFIFQSGEPGIMGYVDASFIKIEGYAYENIPYYLNSTHMKGVNILNLQTTTSLKADDYVVLMHNLNVGVPWAKEGQVMQIKNSGSNGQQLIMKDAISTTYGISTIPYVYKFYPAKNIGIEDITIERSSIDGASSSQKSNIEINYAANVWIYGVESHNTTAFHIGINHSSYCLVHGCFIYDANDYSGDGHGYGVVLQYQSTNCLIENNVFRYLRHAMLTQASSNKNVFAYNYSYNRAYCSLFEERLPDLCLHGSGSHANLFEGNFIEEMSADDSHDGYNGYYQTFLRNKSLMPMVISDMYFYDSQTINFVGNDLISNRPTFDGCTNKLDFYGFVNDVAKNHYDVFQNSSYRSQAWNPIVSLYRFTKPNWMDNNFSWPPIGPKQSTYSSATTGAIPAMLRVGNGSFTVAKTPLNFTITLSNGYYQETNTYGGSYRINGSTSNSYTGSYNEIITLQAIPINNGETFYKWSDGNDQNPRSYQLKNNATLFAIFKKPNISSSITAYTKDGQRKFVRSFDGGLWKVYESMGSLWLEKNGQIVNNGSPINILSEGPEAKSASIDFVYESYTTTSLFIVYQQKTLDGKYKIKLAKFNESGQKIYTYDLFSSTNDYTTFDAMPVIAATRNPYNAAGKTKFLIVWKQKAEASYQDGLYFYTGMDNGSTVTWYYLTTPQKIGSTDVNSKNPTLGVYKLPNNSVVIQYHLVWQQSNSSIKYKTLWDNWNGSASGGVVETGTLQTPSSGSGWETNYDPTITVTNNGTGSNTGLYTYDMPKLVWKSDGTVVTHRGRSNSMTSGIWQTFYNYLENDDITSVSINMGLDESTFVIAFAELEGYYNFYVKSSNLNTRVNMGTHGKNLQVSNYYAFWEGVDINIFKNMSGTASPYSFQVYNFYDELIKTNNLKNFEGRISTISKENSVLSFGLINLNLDGNPLKFVSIDENDIINTDEKLNTYTTTEPFDVDDNSEINFTTLIVNNDSMSIFNNLKNNANIKIKVELVDDINGTVLGIFDDIIIDKSNIITSNRINHKVKTNGVNNRKVKLRYTIENNVSNTYYVLSNIVSDGNSQTDDEIKLSLLNEQSKVSTYELEQNYPNPFNPNTTIRYQLPNDGFVILIIYDVLGNEIATLVNEEKQSGRYQVEFDATNLSSGIYLYSVRVGDFNVTKKMILLK